LNGSRQRKTRFGGVVGLTIIEHIDVELGYESLPIKIEAKHSDGNYKESKDLGGFMLRARYIF